MANKVVDNDEEIIFGKALYPSTGNPMREVIYDKENPIGEPFFTKKYGLLVAVEAKEGDDCEKCAIYNTKKKKCGAATMNIGSCSPHYREDGKEVIFKHVEDVKEGEV